MQKKILREAEQYRRRNQRKRVWRKFVRVMACIVVFCTTYLMILPAITMEKNTCGLAEHVHGETCYRKVTSVTAPSLACSYESLGVHEHTADCRDADGKLTCGQADFLVHIHTDECTAADGTLVCRLPSVRTHEHTDSCYAAAETESTAPETPAAQSVHTHTDDCYTTERGELICQKDETEGHTHGDNCFTRGELTCELDEQESHTHNENCSETVLICDLTVEPHIHGNDCYRQLICDLPEDETHTHSEECSGKILNCDLTEQPHNHTQACYQTNSLCDKPETEGHSHGASCYESLLICDLPEEPEHHHADDCYEQVSRLICPLEEGVPTETEEPEEEIPPSEPTEPELICGKEVIRLHTHNEDRCYEAYIDNAGNKQKRLTCTDLGVLEHKHEESCYVTEEVPAEDADILTCALAENHVHEDSCYDENGALICEKVENHTHGNMCYGTWELICGKDAHTHTDECRSAESTEASTAPTEPAEVTDKLTASPDLTNGITGSITQTDTSMLNSSPGISVMSMPVIDYIKKDQTIEGTNVHWELYKDGRGEYHLHFYSDAAENNGIPNYSDDSTNRYWLHDIAGKTPLHLEFSGSVNAIGDWAFEGAAIDSIAWGNIKTIGNYAFYISIGPEVLDIPGQVDAIGAFAFYGNTAVQSIVLHDGTKTIGRAALSVMPSTPIPEIFIPASVTLIDGPIRSYTCRYTVAADNPKYTSDKYGVLFDKDMTELLDVPKGMKVSEYRIPDGVEIVRGGTIGYIDAIGRLIIPPSVHTLEASVFQGGHISEVYIEDGSQLKDVNPMQFNTAVGLINIRYPENTEIPLFPMFGETYRNEFIKYTHFTIPNGITEIPNLGGTFSNLETLTYNAKQANITATQLFTSCPPYDLIIGADVDHLPANFSRILSSAATINFHTENTFTADSGAFNGAGEPLENLYGKFHVDENGIVYQCMDDGTAKVVYVTPNAAADLEIPATIQTIEQQEDGTPFSMSYRVTSVGSYAFSSAKDLKTLHFESPENITSLDDYAMANCPTLERVNEATNKQDAENIFNNPNVQKGNNLFRNTLLDPHSNDQDGDGILDGTGKEMLIAEYEGATMEIRVLDNNTTLTWVENGSETGLHQLLTGDVLKVHVSAGNIEGHEEHVYRIYFRTTGEGSALDVVPGSTIKCMREDGTYLEATCHGTEDPDVVYLEFTLDVGSSLQVSLGAAYPTKTTGGGGVEVWGEISDKGQPASTLPPTDIIQAQWITKPDPFVLSKTGGYTVTSITSNGNGNGGGKPGSNLNWTIELKLENQALYYGKDYLETAVFTDVVTFPEGFSWNSDFVTAVQNGTAHFVGNSLYFGNYKAVTITPTTLPGAKMSLPEAVWDGANIVFSWKLTNIGDSEMNGNKLTFCIHPEAIDIIMATVQTDKTYSITNTVSADLTHRYSSSVPLDPVSAKNNIRGGTGTLQLNKIGSTPKFLGEDIKYTLELSNSGAVPYVKTKDDIITLTDSMPAQVYIKPENMELMLDAYPNLTVYINNATLSPWVSVTGADGTEAWVNSGNSNNGSAGHTLVISLAENGEYQVLVDGALLDSPTPTDLTAMLKQAGYAVTGADSYSCHWALNNADTDYILDAGEHQPFHIFATIKDTFSVIAQDWPFEYSTAEGLLIRNQSSVYYGDTTDPNNVIANATAVDTFVKQEAFIAKSVYRDGSPENDLSEVANGDVLTYHLDFYHKGNGDYHNLPIVDDLYGNQYLLVPIAGNGHLEASGLQVHDGAYYILTEGTYTDVTVGIDDDGNNLIAASIVVTKTGNEIQTSFGSSRESYNGMHTTIKWYFPALIAAEESSTSGYHKQIKYNVLVDMTIDNTYTIGNAVWVNDRTDKRIFTYVWDEGTLIDFKKEIMVKNGDLYEPESNSKICRGDQVLYRVTLHNTNDFTYELTNEEIRDALPDTFGVFEWNTSNVVLTGIETQGNGITYNENLLRNWSFSENLGGYEGENRQYIIWEDDFTIRFTEESSLYLYFTLTFPSDETVWNQYIEKVNGAKLTNTFYVYRFPYSVTHDLDIGGQAILQKGVFGMYRFNKNQGGAIKYTAIGTSRSEYNNIAYFDRVVMYYVTLYNEGYSRLYLNTMYDRLPEGFSFIQMMNSSPQGKDVNTKITSATTYGGITLNNGLIQTGNAPVSFRSATVTSHLDNGLLTFTFGPGTGNYPIHYDEARGKYYLNRGEAIVFGYTVNTGEKNKTPDQAVNTIAMPYDSYLDNTVDLSNLTVHAKDTSPFTETNDGKSDIKANDLIVNQYGFPSSDSEQWLVSDVVVERGNIFPGVEKFTVEYTTLSGARMPYTHGVSPTDTIHWRIRMHNAGPQAVIDYVISDIMPAPYVFEGPIDMQFYDGINSSAYRSRYVGKILPREEGATSVILVDESGKRFTIPIDGTWVDLTSGGWLLISLDRDENGNEVLRLHCSSSSIAIAENGGYVDMTLSSKNPTDIWDNKVYINRAILDPQADFDHAYAGTMTTGENGQPVVENISPVNVSYGFTTSSETRVTEDSNSANTAVSTDISNNSILLEDVTSTFTYTLTVGNDTDAPMTKLVIIDNLPQPGDHMPFDPNSPRQSGFKVDFADDPNFTVFVEYKDPDTKETVRRSVSSDAIKIEYSSDTNFGTAGSSDWKGDETGKWYSTREAVLANTGETASAFRLIVRDESGTEIPSGAKILITFDAKADVNAAPGSIAWNNFGYHYKLQGYITEAEAMPLSVGVSIPSAPTLRKQLVGLDGISHAPAKNNAVFHFLVYEGEPLTGFTPDTLLDAVIESGRLYKEITIGVPQGVSQSAEFQLKDVPWTWTTGSRYTIAEIGTADKYSFYRFKKASYQINDTDEWQFGFTYDPNFNQAVVCENMVEEWSVHVKKTDLAGNALSGAVFALYSPLPADQISGDIPWNATPTVTAEGQTWYLMSVVQTGADGILNWSGLTEDSYYLLELRAPTGYNLPDKPGRVLHRSTSTDVIPIVNRVGYEIPKTGGAGTTPYTLGGLLLMTAAAILLYIHNLKRRKEAMTSF